MLGQLFVRAIIALLAFCYVTEAETGQNGGYFYQFWQDQPGFATYSNGPNGQYSLKWSGNGDVVAGKGWQTGSARYIGRTEEYGVQRMLTPPNSYYHRTITYDADYNPQGNSYMAVYGWTRSPEIEYYIVENYGSYNPISSGTKKGTVTSDGSTYDIAVATRTNAPSISGTSTFQQFWSVRTSKRSSGTVTTSNHFEAWKKAGLQLGSFDLQIFAVEGYHSSGSATVTVGGSSASGYGGGNTTTAPAGQGKDKSPGNGLDSGTKTNNPWKGSGSTGYGGGGGSSNGSGSGGFGNGGSLGVGRSKSNSPPPFEH